MSVAFINNKAVLVIGAIVNGGGSTAYTNIANSFTVSPQTITSDDDTHKVLVVKSHSATQTANEFEVQDSLSNPLAAIGVWEQTLSYPYNGSDPSNVGNNACLGRTQFVQTITESLSGGAFFNNPAGVLTLTTVDPAQDDPNYNEYAAFLAVAHVPSTNSKSIGELDGIAVIAQFEGTGGHINDTSVVGANIIATNTGPVWEIAGIVGSVNVWADAYNSTYGGAIACDYFVAVEAGSAARVTGVKSHVLVEGTGTVSGDVQLFHGRSIQILDGRTVHGNHHGLRIDDQYTTAVVGQCWNVYSEDTTGNSKNYFGGMVGIGAVTLDASVKLQINSTTQGFLPPRMTTNQKNAIATPALGLMIFDTDLNKICVKGVAGWETMTSS